MFCNCLVQTKLTIYQYVLDDFTILFCYFLTDATKKASIPPSRTGSRMAVPMAMATGVGLDDLVPSAHTPKSAPSQASQRPSPLPGE